MEVLPVSYMPGDPMLIDKIVCELKSQGIFDSFRKECIEDVDTKPAYLNLRQRVEGSVTGFLRKQKWNPDMNKNQLREMLRKNIYESGFLETGVERIVDQVVNPKMNTVFLPKVTDVVYKYLGIDRPTTRSNERRLERIGISMENLLPHDLEAVSPESDRMNDSGNADDDEGKMMDEDESPPFEPIDEQQPIAQEENSVDSHLSGFSGLLSHESNQSDGQRPLQIDMDTQMSKQSSDRESIVTDDQSSKMEICCEDSGDANLNPKPPEAEVACSKPSEGNQDSDKSSSSVKEEKEKKEKKRDERERDRDRHKSDRHRSRTDRKDERKSDRDKKDKYKKDSKSRSDKDRHRSSSSKHSSSASKKDASSKHRSESKDDKGKERQKEKDSKKSKSSSGSKSDRHRKSSSSSSRRDKEKDKKDGKKPSKDDHYGSKPHRSERRSTDRDSNDGSGLKSSSSSYCESNSSSQNSASQPTTKPQDSSNSNSNDSGNSDATERRVPVVLDAAGEIAAPQPRRLIKPKIASNIYEARRLMKIRKQLRKIELDSLKTELSIKQDAVVDSEIPRPVTPPLGRSVSMATWDAMEAKLNQNVNYDSYYDPEFAEEISDAKVIKDRRSDTTTKKGEEDRRNIEESEHQIKQQQSTPTDDKDYQKETDDRCNKHTKQDPTIDCQIKEVDRSISNKKPRKVDDDDDDEDCKHFDQSIRQIKEGADTKDEVCGNKKPRKADDEGDDCKYFAQSSVAEDEGRLRTSSKHLMALRKVIRDLEMNIELSLCNNVPKADARDVNKENKHVGGTKRKSAGCDSFRKIRNNNNFIEAAAPEEKFPLPLSPSDSDKSVERKTETETERKHTIKSQRYASEELYKPRPVIRHTSRRRRGGTLE